MKTTKLGAFIRLFISLSTIAQYIEYAKGDISNWHLFLSVGCVAYVWSDILMDKINS